MEWNSVMSGLVGGGIATLLGYLTLRRQRAGRKVEGWTVLRPSGYEHFAFAIAAGFSLFMAYIYLFVGSARADAEEQEIYMLLLMGGFGAGGILVWWTSYALKIRWREHEVEASRFGRTRRFDLREVVRVKRNDYLNSCTLVFRGGRKLSFSYYQHGAKELIRAAEGKYMPTEYREPRDF